MTVAVREAAPDDLDAILEVAEAAWYAAYGGVLDPSTIAAALETYYDPELVETAIDHDDIVFYVASEEEDIVGFASAEQTWADEVELHTIYAHPDRWGSGVGSALLEQVSEWASAQDVDRIVCGVLADNAIGIGFFEAVGFIKGPRTEAEIKGEVHPEYEFERPL